MSPVGRIFLVLNLGLAGAFLAFAGTYLKRADDWKTKFETAGTKAAQEIEDLSKKSKGFQDGLNDEKRRSSVLTTQNKALQTKVEEAERDNKGLQERLTALESTMKSNTSHLGNIQSELAAARTDSKAAMDKAIAAEAAKDDAESKMNAALKSLADANFKIQNQDKTIGDQVATLALRDQKIRQDQVLLDLVNRRYPGIYETLHPLVTGSVSKVGSTGNLVTIALESGAENLKSGQRFAIFNAADGYKGEATVSEVDPSKQFCFARLTLKQGKEIQAGDSASTNLSQSRSN